MKTIICNANIVNEGEVAEGSVLISDDCIEEVFLGKEALPASFHDTTENINIVDAKGCYLLPGVIDSHVHFREPGLTEKADIDTESCAAAAGGVTSYFDMPNCNPQTTTLEALDEKFSLARQKSHVNYSFFFGATNDNACEFARLDIHRIPGIKLFMGSSTGNMLVDDMKSLDAVFSTAVNVGLPIMAHCEDTSLINENMEKAKAHLGDDPDLCMHSQIRSREACCCSTSLAIELAEEHNARLHIAHISTLEEAMALAVHNNGKSLNDKMITAEAVVGHLLFTEDDMQQLGAKIKVNPAIKTNSDRTILRKGLKEGVIDVVATDHAPHLLSQKQGGCSKAASGMPMVQFSLVAMLELVDNDELSIEQLVQLMCHNPALLFGVSNRGFIRRGYKADLVLVRPSSPWTVTKECIKSKCNWSPLEGHTFNWKVERTICNGHEVYDGSNVDKEYIGEEISFRQKL